MVDAGEVIIRLGADISALKQGLSQVRSELQQLKTQAEANTHALAGMNSAISGLQGQIGGAVNGLASFLGYALSIYGVLNLWKDAVMGWYNLLKSGVDAVNDYRMAVISASGLMTSVSDVPAPEMEKAYGAWRTYFDWLYHESLAADKRVAASGREIFEAGMELAMRGLVPKTEQQVYLTGLLVDMVKATTKGLSEKQQLWQEIRSLFEGKVRLGAQLLQKFTQIDPDFINNLNKAREAAMRMGDSLPIWQLLEKVLKGMSYASNDMQMTMDSLVNTTKAGFQLLMIEAFGPAYDSIVQMGWGLLEVFYNNGQLTEQGRLLASVLSAAWNQVEGAVREYIEYIKANPRVVIDMVETMVKALTNAAQAAMTVAQAIVTIAESINTLDLTKIISLAAILSGIMMGGKVGAVVSLAGAGGLLYSSAKGTKTQLDEALTAIEKDEKRFASFGMKGSPAWTALQNRKTEVQDALKSYADGSVMAQNVGVEALRNLKESAESIDSGMKEGMVGMAAFQAQYSERLKEAAVGTESDTKSTSENFHRALAIREQIRQEIKGDWVKEQALDKAIVEGNVRNWYAAPDVPNVKMQPGQEKKGGGGGRESRYFELLKQYQTLVLKDALSEAETFYKGLLDKDETYRLQLKNKLEMGKMTYQEYYAELTKLNQNEQDRDIKLMELKKRNIEQITKDNLKAIEGTLSLGKIFPEEAEMQKAIEVERRRHEISQADAEIAKIKEKALQNQTKLILEQYELYKKIREELDQQLLDIEAAWGSPLKEREATRGKIETDFKHQTLGMDKSSQEYLDALKIKETKLKQVEYGQAVKDLTNSVINGIQSLIDGMIEGKLDLQKIGLDFFKSMLKTALEPMFNALKDTLTNLFKTMFEELGSNAASAAMGVIALVGIMLLKKGGGSFSASGASSQVTSHEAVRGVIAGDTSIPIAQIGVSLQDALLPTNAILKQIEQNTRGGAGSYDIAGSITEALDKYFSGMAMQAA